MRRFSCLVVVLILHGVSAASQPVSADEPLVRSAPTDPELDRELKAIRTYLEEFTGLKFLRPVVVRRQSVKEFRAQQQAGIERGKADRLRDWKLLRGLNLITTPDQAEARYQSFLTGSLTGYYSFDSREVVLPEDRYGEGATLTHELHHSLIDQHFNLKELIQKANGNDDREMALRAVIEGSAMLAEKVYLREWRETKRALPSARLLETIRRDAADEIARVYAARGGDGTGSLNESTILADCMFAYTFGLHWVVTQAAANADRFVPWSQGLFVPERVPTSTRQILTQAQGSGDLRLDLNTATAAWRQRNPAAKPFEGGVLGELYCRLWLATKGLAAVFQPTAVLSGGAESAAEFGLTADRFIMFERDAETVFGVAVLVFDSPAQAEAVRKLQVRSASRVNANDIRVNNRVLVVPMGQNCPTELVGIVADAVTGLPLPPPADPVGLLRISLKDYLLQGRPEDWARHLADVRRYPDRSGWVTHLAPLVFQTLDANDVIDQAKWPAFDAAQFALGRDAARDLPKLLSPAEVTAMNRAALDALADPDTLELGRLNALRWLTATRHALTDQDRKKAADALTRRFADRPEFVKQARSLFLLNPGDSR